MAGPEREPYSLNANSSACADDQNCTHRASSVQDVRAVLLPSANTMETDSMRYRLGEVQNISHGRDAHVGFNILNAHGTPIVMFSYLYRAEALAHDVVRYEGSPLTPPKSDRIQASATDALALPLRESGIRFCACPLSYLASERRTHQRPRQGVYGHCAILPCGG